MPHKIFLFILIIKKISIHLANCFMTSAVAIFCLPDMLNDTISILTSRCRFILLYSAPQFTWSYNWILGQLIMGPHMRNLMRKLGQKSSWATCTWVRTTKGRYVSTCMFWKILPILNKSVMLLSRCDFATQQLCSKHCTSTFKPWGMDAVKVGRWFPRLLSCLISDHVTYGPRGGEQPAH